MAAVAEQAIGAEDQFVRRETEAPAEYEREARTKLAHLLSKLNPAAKEFFPSNYTAGGGQKPEGRLSADAPIFVAASGFNGNGPTSNGGSSKDSSSDCSSNNQPNRRRRNNYDEGRMKMNNRARRAAREDSINRTVYVSDIDHQVTEEKLAEIFSIYGQVVDCRICGDPHSLLHFAFIEFSDEYGARAALSLGGTVLGYCPMKVLPSKTAIIPVNPKFLPKSENEKEMVIRTVYCTNIDKKVTQTDVKTFFEQHCGEVSRLRLLGDNIHSTRIAFVEFAQAESAMLALNQSGMVLGTLPIRVSPSKTPVRLRIPRSSSN
ncbi:polyadenylate-binding protein-interacting protein 8-like [Curcuma longa]|uniref:polyadenylate-binding protein-interacting protein 8-like n=1 Tax=Curcuma longa TaxID=136217 RepID=UPI003D9E0396